MLLILLVLASCIALGCNGSGPDAEDSRAVLPEDRTAAGELANAEAATGDEPSGVDASAQSIGLQAVDEEEFAEILASHRGSVVLVDFWATWCPPCVELFPHTVELHRELSDDGLVVISFSMDDLQSRDQVEAFLRQQEATFENLISEYGLGARSFEAFAITEGALPHLRLYDRDGNVYETFALSPEKVQPAYIEKKVRALLGQDAVAGSPR